MDWLSKKLVNLHALNVLLWFINGLEFVAVSLAHHFVLECVSSLIKTVLTLMEKEINY
jgi:hypothetical protein